MEVPELDTFWNSCELISRDPEIVHGAAGTVRERGA